MGPGTYSRRSWQGAGFVAGGASHSAGLIALALPPRVDAIGTFRLYRPEKLFAAVPAGAGDLFKPAQQIDGAGNDCR